MLFDWRFRTALALRMTARPTRSVALPVIEAGLKVTLPSRAEVAVATWVDTCISPETGYTVVTIGTCHLIT